MKKVLVVDDEENIRELIRTILEEIGFTVVEAEDGKKAIEKARDEIFDLILLDVMMPFLDGFATLEILKKDIRVKNIPVIMVTAKGDRETVVKSKAEGITDFIVKPFGHDTLLGKVLNALNLSLKEVKKGKVEKSFSVPSTVDGYEVREVGIDGLTEGMVVALPIMFKNKATFLNKGIVLNNTHIQKIKEKEQELEIPFIVRK